MFYKRRYIIMCNIKRHSPDTGRHFMYLNVRPGAPREKDNIDCLKTTVLYGTNEQRIIKRITSEREKDSGQL